MLLPGNITLLCSAPKVGKSTLVFDAVEAILTNGTLLGLRTHTPDAVLYFTEESRSGIDTRIREMNSLALANTKRLRYVLREPGLTWTQTLADVAQFVARYPRTLVIIDTMGFWLEVDDENDASQVRKALQPLIDITRNASVAVLLVHHSRKTGGSHGEGCRGSTAFAGNVDIVLALDRDDRGVKDEAERQLNPKRTLNADSRYSATPTHTNLIWERGKRYRVATMMDSMNITIERDERRYPEVLRLLAQGAGPTKVSELTGVPYGTVKDVAKRQREADG